MAPLFLPLLIDMRVLVRSTFFLQELRNALSGKIMHNYYSLFFFFCFNKNSMVFRGEIFHWFRTVLAGSLTASTFRDFVSFLKSKKRKKEKKKALCLAKITATRAQSTSGDSVYSASKEAFKSRGFFFFFPESWQVQEPE